MNEPDEMLEQRRRLSGWMLILGVVTFWVSWVLMPMPGTTDPAFILEAVAAVRPQVLASCVLQLISAAAWVVGLVIAVAPAAARGRVAWWTGASLLAIGMTTSAADAIYHLAAYELTHPDVAPEAALPVMTRMQGPDLVFLLPGVAAFFAGLVLFVVAGVRTNLVPRAAAWLMALAVPCAAARALLPGTAAPRVAGLLVLACIVAPVAWMGWRLARGAADRSR